MVNAISSSSTASLSELRQQMFNKIDTNSDGSIDKSEMTALIEENTSSLVNSIFGKLDTNQDSLISMIESNSGLSKLEQQMKHGMDGMSGVSGMSAPPPPPEKVFDTADTNKDGAVTKDELASVIGGNGSNIDELFNQVDTNGDGSITREEDEAFRAKMPEQMQQANSSGANTASGLGLDWQSQMLNALLQGLTASANSSETSTSVFA